MARSQIITPRCNKADISGSGAVDATDFTVATGNFDVSGSGQISATVTSSVVAKLSGSGTVTSHGQSVASLATNASMSSGVVSKLVIQRTSKLCSFHT